MENKRDSDIIRLGRPRARQHALPVATPLHLARSAAYFLNRIELVKLRFPRKERLAVRELSHDAADRPHVHWLPVVRLAQKQLRRAVPASR